MAMPRYSADDRNQWISFRASGTAASFGAGLVVGCGAQAAIASTANRPAARWRITSVATLDPAQVRRVFAERGGEIGQVFLLLLEDLADVLGHGVFLEHLALLDARPVLQDGLPLVVEVESQHVPGLVRRPDWLGYHRRVATEVVDLLRDGDRMLEFLAGMRLELRRDRHVFGALEHLRVHHVGDDGLVLPRQVLIEQLDQLRPRHG